MGSTGSGKVSSYCMGVVASMMVLGVAMSELTCLDMNPVMKACGDYAKNGGETVPLDCCMLIIELRNKAMSTHSQQTTCRCLQEAAQSSPDHINHEAYSSLPSRCGVTFPYQFSLTMDCDRYIIHHL